MKTLSLLLFSCGLLFSTQAAAQTIRAQLIHASADPAIETVDVYVDGALLLDDFSYRSATAFMDFDVGSHEILLTPDSSTDTLASFATEFPADSSYYLIVAGVLNPEEFNPNPNGREVDLNLFVIPDARETAPDNQFWGRVFYAGSDLPRLAFTFAQYGVLHEASYGDISEWESNGGEKGRVSLRAANSASSALWETTQDLGAMAGKTNLGIIHGFYRDEDGLGFGFMDVQADGTVTESPDETRLYRAQFVQNSADTSLGAVDLYLDGGLLVRDFEFQSATKFLDLPYGTHEFSIARAGSESSADRVMLKRTTLKESETYSIVAAGVVEPEAWPANPEGRDTGLDLFIADGARESSAGAGEFVLRQFYGVTDLPEVNFYNGSEQLFGENVYGTFTEYVTGDQGAYHGSMRSAVTSASSIMNLLGSFSAGSAYLEMPSGFFRGEKGLGMDWIQVMSDGTVTRPTNETQTFEGQIIHASVDPAVEVVDIYLDGGLLVDDMAYAEAEPFLELPMGVHELAVTPANAAGKREAIATFRTSFAAEKNYLMIMAGVVDPELWPANPDRRDIQLNLFTTDDAFTSSPSPNEFVVRQFYGIGNMPMIDFWLDTYDDLLWSSIGFGDFTPYTTGDTNDEVLGSARPAGSGRNDDWLIQAYADFDRGDAIIGIVTGFFDGQLDWFLVTPDGNTENLSKAVVAAEDESELPSEFVLHGNYPNPFNPSTAITFDLPEPASVSVEVFDATGRMVVHTEEAVLPAGATHAVHVNATAWSSGLYLYKVIARGRTSSWIGSGRMILVK